ncbi:hypothetical protein PCL_07126 [Purpureocillium lilacinum]|uniref:Uncharacterized protein n=1 Tax=Purpureocillium lilacinum TaxID=33203 RepID=A0A2U3DSX6_PURLI|nr:hypothetical protein PCL_07126 [Purpureocillium lilacinum]
MNDDSRLGKGMYEVAVEAGVRRSVVVVAVVVRGVNGGGTKREPVLSNGEGGLAEQGGVKRANGGGRGRWTDGSSSAARGKEGGALERREQKKVSVRTRQVEVEGRIIIAVRKPFSRTAILSTALRAIARIPPRMGARGSGPSLADALPCPPPFLGGWQGDDGALVHEYEEHTCEQSPSLALSRARRIVSRVPPLFGRTRVEVEVEGSRNNYARRNAWQAAVPRPRQCIHCSKRSKRAPGTQRNPNESMCPILQRVPGAPWLARALACPRGTCASATGVGGQPASGAHPGARQGEGPGGGGQSPIGLAPLGRLDLDGAMDGWGAWNGPVDWLRRGGCLAARALFLHLCLRLRRFAGGNGGAIHRGPIVHHRSTVMWLNPRMNGQPRGSDNAVPPERDRAPLVSMEDAIPPQVQVQVQVHGGGPPGAARVRSTYVTRDARKFKVRNRRRERGGRWDYEVLVQNRAISTRPARAADAARRMRERRKKGKGQTGKKGSEGEPCGLRFKRVPVLPAASDGTGAHTSSRVSHTDFLIPALDDDDVRHSDGLSAGPAQVPCMPAAREHVVNTPETQSPRRLELTENVRSAATVLDFTGEASEAGSRM